MSDEKNPLLSILIPTKNRSSTAIICVVEATKVGSPEEVEIVIQDCSDNNILEQLLYEVNLFGRVHYYRTERPVSMVENWNIGTSRLHGEFVTIIGDDDAVYPSIINVARWAKKNNFKAVKQKKYDFFGWPDLFDKTLAEKFIYHDFTGKYDLVNVLDLLTKFSKTGDEYPTFPMVYHNLIRRSVLEDIHDKTGVYFDGVSPDIYSAYAIAAIIDNFIVLDYPFTIVGASKNSNTNRTKVGDGHMHFNEFENYKFTTLSPETWGLYGSNSDSMIKAFINIGRKDLLTNIDITRVFARTIVAEPSRTIEHSKKYLLAVSSFGRNKVLSYTLLWLNIIAKYLLVYLRKLTRTKPVILNASKSRVASIEEAIHMQMDLLERRGIVLGGR
ncbi:MAG: glycosyltransferase [Candidatus Contendobacter sp.]|nr:glycosyltransferase [Candidatus Contendobacter sp.]